MSPVKIPRGCITPGCKRVAVKGGRCSECGRGAARERYQREGPMAARGYGTTWQKLRLVVLRDEPLCRGCAARGLTVAATDVDHIVPLKDGGSNLRSNLQPLCHACHSRKTMAETRVKGHV